MKKILALIVTAVALAVPAQAQVSFGLKGGLNLTSVSLSEGSSSDVSNKSGFFVGPTVKFTLPVVGLGIDASALYDKREAEVKASGEKLKQQSIQIPVNIRYGFGLGDLASIYLFAGPQFGFNIGDKDTKLTDIGADWTLKSSNLSANVGLGAMLVNHLQVSINYNFALGKTGEVSFTQNNITQSTDVKANAWQIAVAYYF